MEGKLKCIKVLGSRNPADALAKHMASTLLDQHLETVGLDSRDGRAESAPGLNSATPRTESRVNKRVRFNGIKEFRQIPSEGRGKSLAEVKATKALWQKKRESDDTGSSAQKGFIRELEGEIGGKRSRQSADELCAQGTHMYDLSFSWLFFVWRKLEDGVCQCGQNYLIATAHSAGLAI